MYNNLTLLITALKKFTVGVYNLDRRKSSLPKR